MTRWLSWLFILTLVLSACTPIQLPADAPAPVATGSLPVDDLGAPLPVDPAVRVGALNNGLTYYVRRNTEPMNRAELWLAVNAGSILEEDDQQGLAHFLEHMLFNGTENFPGFGIVDFLESIGMAFGPDVNARTSFDETVYTIQAPTGDAETLAKALQVLKDWAAHATLDPKEIEQERGIIVEEWRLRDQTAAGRISNQLLPFILGDSRYAERLPIGDMDIVRSAPREAFTRFYETWYRPDLMAVIAVGDFDPDEMERLIQELFADLPMPDAPQPRPVYDLPSHEGTRYQVIDDPEQPSTQLTIFTLRPAEPIATAGDVREDVTTDLYYLMMNSRLEEIARAADAPFLSASSGSGSLVRPVDAAVIGASVQEEKALVAAEALVTEIERARRHGFTETELQRSRNELLNLYARLYNERDNTASRSYADEYLRHYLTGEAIPSVELVFGLVQELLPQITLEEVNDKAAILADDDNRLLYITGPRKEETPLPSEDDLAAVVAALETADIPPYVDSAVSDDLIETLPQPAAIVDETELPDLGVTALTLENGVHVLLKPTDFKDDEIVFNAVSPGGSSLYPDEDFPNASTIDDVVNESGVGDFTQTDLAKALAGKTVTVTPYIRELTEGFDGSAAPADLETLFQLVHLYFTAPRADEAAFEAFRAKQRTALVNRAQDPNAALQDALYAALYGDTIRRGPLTVEAIDTLDLARGFEIYQDRFADAGDFTFTFTGSFDMDEIKSLAQTYLGTLPAAGRVETWQDVAPDLPEGVIKEDVLKGEGDRSVVQMIFSGPLEPSREAELRLNAVAGVLDIVLREKLREELGGVYSSSAYAFIQDAPKPGYFVAIAFGTDPGRVDELVDAVFEQIADLQDNGPSAVNVEKVMAQQASSREVQLEQNSYWLTNLKDYVVYGDEDKLSTLRPEFQAAIGALTAESIQADAQQFLRSDRYIQVTLFPEAYAPDAE